MLSGLPCICKVCNRLWKEYDGKNGEDQRRRPRWCRRLHVCAAPRAGQALGRSALANFLREVLTRLRQRMDGSARSMEFKYGLSLYKRKGIVNQTGAIRITKSCDKPNRHDLGPGCKDLGGSRTRCAPVFRLKLVAGQPGPLSTKPSPSFGLAPGRLAEPAMRDFLIATINPIEMSKTESAKFTRRSRPELIAR